ncbi:hypothetical protein F5887DRAFT_1166249 [Amanita rubescens]|nr:hypothetical protein F5887DRAFT_1166249 [Amanita rubescens]
MGGNIRPPGKSGLSFELIFSRLQGELQKTKDTGAELQNLTSSLGEIQDTLGGALPQNMPPPYALPSVCPAQSSLAATESSASISSITSPEVPPQSQPAVPSETLLEIQTRLQDTQTSLASRVDKIRALETILTEQEALKRETRVLRDMMESRECDLLLSTAQHAQEADRKEDDHASRKPRSNFGDDDEDDDDDARSIATVTVGELEQEKHRRREEIGRPRTPEPTMAMHAVMLNGSSSHRSLSPTPKERTIPAPVDTSEISEQLSVLSEQVRAVLAVKSALEAQHITAQATIQVLEKKVDTLVAIVKSTQEQVPALHHPSNSPSTSPKSLTEILWKKKNGQERERLNRAREEFEAEARQGLEKISVLESTVNAVQQTQTSHGHQLTTLQTWMTRIHEGITGWFQPNGEHIRHDISSGLVTLPSPPRSRSSDSARYRRRRKSAGTKIVNAGADEFPSRESSPASSPVRGGSRSRSRERRAMKKMDATLANDDNYPLSRHVHERAEQKLVALLKRAEEDEEDDQQMLALAGEIKEYVHIINPEKSLATPDSPVVDRLSLSGSVTSSVEQDDVESEVRKKGVEHEPVPIITVKAVGVLVLSVAAAAVIWRNLIPAFSPNTTLVVSPSRYWSSSVDV